MKIPTISLARANWHATLRRALVLKMQCHNSTHKRIWPTPLHGYGAEMAATDEDVDVELVWPFVADSVSVTGDFTEWKSVIPMTKRADGIFGE